MNAPSHQGWADTIPWRPAAVSEALTGLVERVTFHNPDNGFCVLRVKVRGQRDLEGATTRGFATEDEQFVARFVALPKDTKRMFRDIMDWYIRSRTR